MAWFDYLCLILFSTAISVYAQPSPEQQKRISAAIKNAAHNKTIDFTQFVNPFIGKHKIVKAMSYHDLINLLGTDNFGDVCPGASVPFGMVRGGLIDISLFLNLLFLKAKFTIDMTGYAPAGYVFDPTQEVRGLSPLHDSGTGSSLGEAS